MFLQVSRFPLEILLKCKGNDQKYTWFPMIFNDFPVNLKNIRESFKNIPFEKFFRDRIIFF